MKLKRVIAAAVLPAAFLLAGCNTSKSQQKGGQAAASEQTALSDSFQRMSKAQQIPTFDWSQVRQTVIDVETAQANGAVSTTAFYLEGIGLIGWCSSVGAPVASTTQLSADQQYVDLPGDKSNSLFSVQQGEPTGVYPGASSGTWTICTDDKGKKWAKYWEGYVMSDIGLISYPADKRIVNTGTTYTFTEKPK